jgi:hypothetical protein
MSDEGSFHVTCRTCGARFDRQAWSMLRLVERVEPDAVKRMLVDWSTEHCIEIRSCGQCAREVPAQRLAREVPGHDVERCAASMIVVLPAS